MFRESRILLLPTQDITNTGTVVVPTIITGYQNTFFTNNFFKGKIFSLFGGNDDETVLPTVGMESGGENPCRAMFSGISR